MEKIEQLKTHLAEAEKLARELIEDKAHAVSVHVVPIRARVTAALESLGHHQAFIASQAKPAKK